MYFTDCSLNACTNCSMYIIPGLNSMPGMYSLLGMYSMPGMYSVAIMYSMPGMYRTPWAQNLSQGIVRKTSFKTEFHEWGYVFCRYQYFCYEILYYLVSSYSPFFESLKLKLT